MEKARLAEFGSIDQTADPDFFIRFLDSTSAEASFQAYKRRMLELLDLREGHQALDAGCGTGDDARTMALAVGPGGRIVGIDNSQAMIAVAQQRAAGTGFPVEFRVEDVLHLPFAAESFDACRADRSLMHVPDPRLALAEMMRVTRRGGRIVVYEVDFETVVIDADNRVMARKVVNTWCDSFRNGWLGRHIPALLAELGLQDITVAPYTLMLTPALAPLMLGTTTVDRAVAQGLLTPAESRAWLEQLDALQRSGRFFSSLTGFLAAGRR
jgi:ubiquinone/menaquinone biosynthesis C-methylase UbiE